ncbi:MAG: dynamin family protein [Homoserinimonas sp.]
MNDDPSATLAELVQDAITVYHDDPEAVGTLQRHARRLDEPLRVAVAGMVKAGKSTLINAIMGEEIAPTGTGECTRIVTWYRYGDTPRVTMHPRDGEPLPLAVRRTNGLLDFDLRGASAHDVDRLVVEWPNASLRDMTLIDTPGIASLSGDVSARSTDILIPDSGTSATDAIIYVMRHLHEADLSFLQSFGRTSANQPGAINALAVISRADEIGAGRIDSLLAARDIARRYRDDGALRSVAMGVVPVAGLLAQTARTMQQAEFGILLELAELDKPERERMLMSADRFVRPTTHVAADDEARAALLRRFGLFGIRLATVLIGSGTTDPTELARELARRSGLHELQRLITGQFQVRAEHLKAYTALVAVETLVRERPRSGTDSLTASLERIRAGVHEFRELRLLAISRTSGLGLPRELGAEVERLIGGSGVEPADRLGLGDDAAADDVRAEALAALERWRSRAEHPLTDRAAAEVCRTVVRSCEALLASVPGSESSTRLAHDPEPDSGSGEQAGYQPRAG